MSRVDLLAIFCLIQLRILLSSLYPFLQPSLQQCNKIVAHGDPQWLSCQAAFYLGDSQNALVPGAVPLQVGHCNIS